MDPSEHSSPYRIAAPKPPGPPQWVMEKMVSKDPITAIQRQMFLGQDMWVFDYAKDGSGYRRAIRANYDEYLANIKSNATWKLNFEKLNLILRIR